MDISVGNLLVSLIVSAVGLAYTTYGKRIAQANFIVCGISLMVFPYLVDSLWLEVGIGVALAAVPFTVWR